MLKKKFFQEIFFRKEYFFEQGWSETTKILLFFRWKKFTNRSIGKGEERIFRKANHHTPGALPYLSVPIRTSSVCHWARYLRLPALPEI